MKKHVSFQFGLFVFCPVMFLLTSCVDFSSTPTPPDSISEEQTALIRAVLDPRQTDISQAAEKAGDPNFIDPRGISPLEYAVISTNTDKIRTLLRYGADPRFPDIHGFSAVHAAAALPDTAPLECLLESGVSPDVTGPGGKTPLMEALRLGCAETARLLLAKKADLNKADDRGRVPISFAAMARTRSLELVDLLLEHGARLDVQDEDGQTPLSLAIDSGNTETALSLLSALPDFNSGTDTDLIGFLAMKHAVTAGNIFLAGKILEKNLEINTTLSLIYKTLTVVNVEGLHELLARNGLIDDGKNALFWAAEADDPEMIQFLLDHGANPHALDSAGNRPLAYARKLESTRILKRAMEDVKEQKQKHP